MVAFPPLSQGAEAGVQESDEFAYLARFAGDERCQEILVRLFQRSISGKDTSILDLHQQLGLPLQEAFTSLRMLEFAKIIDIIDNPSDPFGALLRIRKNGIEALRRRAAEGIGD